MRKAALRPIALAAALISIGFAGAPHKALALRRPEASRGEILSPHSKPAHIRVAYRYTLAFGCGFAPWVDFDASFWDVPNEAAYVQWLRTHGPPAISRIVSGTMTLLNSDHARFVWAHSGLVFIRHHGKKRLTTPVCN